MPPRVGRTNYLVAATLVGLVTAVALYPFFYVRQAPKLQYSDKALTGDALVRGNYVNTGSRDVGPDPKANTYSYGK